MPVARCFNLQSITYSEAQSRPRSRCGRNRDVGFDSLSGFGGLHEQLGMELDQSGQPALQGPTLGQDPFGLVLNGGLEFRMAAEGHHLRE